jgi:thiamine biosynthesis lipoprotein
LKIGFWIIGLLTTGCLQAQTLVKRTVTLMGSRWDITLVCYDSLTGEKYIDTVIAEVTRIEYLISDWKTQTQVSEINRQAGITAVRVDSEVLTLTQRALQWSKITGGAFDISFAAMDRIWKFDGSMTEMPTPEAIRKSVEKVGHKNIEIDTVASTIFLKLPGMKIGFGALGEGYAADRCRELMEAKGIKAGIINGSGDMSVWGQHPSGEPWTIGLAHPKEQDELFAVIPLQQKAVTTSGNYEKYVLFNGKRYAHIINPATGYPATGLTSVTVIGPFAETANGLSTSIMVLGAKKGRRLIKEFPDYSCVMINDKGKVILSKNLSKKIFKGWKI